MKILPYKKQRGFSLLAILLLSFAIVCAIGAWSLSGYSNISTANNLTVKANSIIEDSQSIKVGYDNLVFQGNNISSIVFIPYQNSSNSAPNILDPTLGIVLPTPSALVLREGINSPEGIWVYNPTGFKGKNIGTNANDPVILLAGIKDNVCSEINRLVYGNTTNTYYNATSSLSLVSDATTNNPTSLLTIDLTNNSLVSGPDTSNWLMGCLFTTGGSDNNVFFRVLRAM